MKDHVPSDFSRKSGYKSDLEFAETQEKAVRINTNFAHDNQNVYVHVLGGVHEHLWYNVKSRRMGWHGANYPTHSNHPKDNRTNPEGGRVVETRSGYTERVRSEASHLKEADMTSRHNSFVERLKADKAAIHRLNEVSRNASHKQIGIKNGATDGGGQERGDSGPASHGRESGYKAAGPSQTAKGHAVNGQAPSGHGEGHAAGQSHSSTGISHSAGNHGINGHGGGH